MNEDEIAIPLEITDLKSDNGDILGIVKLRSGNFGLGAYSFDQKNGSAWIWILANIFTLNMVFQGMMM